MKMLKKRKTRITFSKDKKLKQLHGPHFLIMIEDDLKVLRSLHSGFVYIVLVKQERIDYFCNIKII